VGELRDDFRPEGAGVVGTRMTVERRLTGGTRPSASTLLARVRGRFAHVTFAVLDHQRGAAARGAFARACGRGGSGFQGEDGAVEAGEQHLARGQHDV
jgi:hypothetical protein